MQTQISIFNFESTKQVRTAVHEDGGIWFCLPDVARVLEISNANPSRFNLSEAGVHKMYISYDSGKKQVTFVNEPNLYRVIFRSNKDEAVKFQNWVFDEVLPSIRKTGQYRHTISIEQQAQIQKAVKAKCQSNKLHYQALYHHMYDKFGVKSYKDILAVDFEQALAFIYEYAFCHNRNVNIALNYTSDSVYQNIKSQEQIDNILILLQSLVDSIGDLQGRLKKQDQLLRISQQLLK